MKQMILYKQRAWLGQQIRRLGWWIDSFSDENMTLAEKALAIEFVYCEIGMAESCDLEVRENDGSDRGKTVSQKNYATDGVIVLMPLSSELAALVNLPSIKPRNDLRIVIMKK